MIAFDADVLIYAAVPGHDLGRRVLQLFPDDDPDDDPNEDPNEDPDSNDHATLAGIGSTLLVPELLIKPTRDDRDEEIAQLARLLSRLQLIEVDQDIVDLAVVLGAQYRLKAPDAIHLATALDAGADQFLTNNSRDFDIDIEGIKIISPADLLDGGLGRPTIREF